MRDAGRPQGPRPGHRWEVGGVGRLRPRCVCSDDLQLGGQDAIGRGEAAGLSSVEQAELRAARATELLNLRWCPQKTVRGNLGDRVGGSPSGDRCPGVGGFRIRFLRMEARRPSARSIRHVWLTDMICQVHTAPWGHLRSAKGPRRAHDGLWDHGRAQRGGDAHAETRIAGPSGDRGRHRRVAPEYTAADLVDRRFTRSEPDPTNCG